MDVVYRTNWIAKTRRRAVWLVFWYVLVISPAAMQMLRESHEPAFLTSRFALALTPILLVRLCWRFLAEAETRHPEPTPEMEFVFRFMNTILLGLGAVVMSVLSVI